MDQKAKFELFLIYLNEKKNLEDFSKNAKKCFGVVLKGRPDVEGRVFEHISDKPLLRMDTKPCKCLNNEGMLTDKTLSNPNKNPIFPLRPL